MAGQAALGQQSIVGGNFKASNDQIEALLLQNSMLGQPSQGEERLLQKLLLAFFSYAIPDSQFNGWRCSKHSTGATTKSTRGLSV